jgi:hypothetical protein
MRTKAATRFLTLALFIVGAYRLRQRGVSMKDIQSQLKVIVQGIVANAVRFALLIKAGASELLAVRG